MAGGRTIPAWGGVTGRELLAVLLLRRVARLALLRRVARLALLRRVARLALLRRVAGRCKRLLLIAGGRLLLGIRRRLSGSSAALVFVVVLGSGQRKGRGGNIGGVERTVLSILPRRSLVYQSSRVSVWPVLFMNSTDSSSKQDVQSINPPTSGSASSLLRKACASVSTPTWAIWKATAVEG
jgi:hypothetical protein